MGAPTLRLLLVLQLLSAMGEARPVPRPVLHQSTSGQHELLLPTLNEYRWLDQTGRPLNEWLAQIRQAYSEGRVILRILDGSHPHECQPCYYHHNPNQPACTKGDNCRFCHKQHGQPLHIHITIRDTNGKNIKTFTKWVYPEDTWEPSTNAMEVPPWRRGLYNAQVQCQPSQRVSGVSAAELRDIWDTSADKTKKRQVRGTDQESAVPSVPHDRRIVKKDFRSPQWQTQPPPSKPLPPRPSPTRPIPSPIHPSSQADPHSSTFLPSPSSGSAPNPLLAHTRTPSSTESFRIFAPWRQGPSIPHEHPTPTSIQVFPPGVGNSFISKSASDPPHACVQDRQLLIPIPTKPTFTAPRPAVPPPAKTFDQQKQQPTTDQSTYCKIPATHIFQDPKARLVNEETRRQPDYSKVVRRPGSVGKFKRPEAARVSDNFPSPPPDYPPPDGHNEPFSYFARSLTPWMKLEQSPTCKPPSYPPPHRSRPMPATAPPPYAPPNVWKEGSSTPPDDWEQRYYSQTPSTTSSTLPAIPESDSDCDFWED